MRKRLKASALMPHAWRLAPALSLTLVLDLANGSRCQAATPSQESVPGPADSRQATTATVTARGQDAWAAFDELGRQGLKVYMLGGRRDWQSLLVPAELRFKPIDGRKLIEAVAATREFKIAWVRDGRGAVLYSSASDEDVEQTRKDLASPDTAVRCHALWRTRWLQDVRIVPWLVKAAKDADAEVARQALISLRRAGWDVVLVLDDAAEPLVVADLDFMDTDKQYCVDTRYEAAATLGSARQERALLLARKALGHKWLCDSLGAVRALGEIGGEEAIALLRQAFADRSGGMRMCVASALGRIGGEDALKLLEGAIGDKDVEIRVTVAAALGATRGDKAVGVLEKMMADPDVKVRRAVASALGRAGGAKSLTVLKSMLNEKDSSICRAAITALGDVGGEEVFAPIEKALADQDVYTVCAAIDALGSLGGEKACILLEGALKHRDAFFVGSAAATALGVVGGDRAFSIIKRLVSDRNADPNVRGGAVVGLGNLGGDKALAIVEEAATDADFGVRANATHALMTLGGEKTLSLLGKLLADKDEGNRHVSFIGLKHIGGDRVRDLFLARLTAEKDADILKMIKNCLVRDFYGDPAVDKALPEAAARSVKPPPEHPPRPPIPEQPEVF
jgi:HEAT repeat protein